MFGQPGRRGEELFEGWPFGYFALLRLATISACIQILVEESTDIKFVEWIGLRLFGDFFCFYFEEIFVAVIVGLSGLLALLFEDRILNHLLVDHLFKFEAVQRQHADHLNEAGRQNLFLRDLEIEFESLPSHLCARSFLRSLNQLSRK